MRIALVGPATAGKTSLANQLAEFIGSDHADVVDLDHFVAQKWNLPAHGLRRLWLLEQSQLPEEDRGIGLDDLLSRRESEFQDCLDRLDPNKITIIAMRTHVFRHSASTYPNDPRKQWWDRFVQDAAGPGRNTYVLRLSIAPEDIYVRLEERFERLRSEYPDMARSFSRWAEATLWANGVPRPRKQAIIDLHRMQVIELVPHYWQFPYLAVKHDGPQISPEQVLQALGLPTDRRDLLRLRPSISISSV